MRTLGFPSTAQHASSYQRSLHGLEYAHETSERKTQRQLKRGDFVRKTENRQQTNGKVFDHAHLGLFLLFVLCFAFKTKSQK